ncbi:hypothetical protein H310_10884 [Aphanomyces invadans]|uniref:Calcineurin-like phosphoesterase domain-containing protein n=1 Tax=Aphanomyces invadans TaxID=157072 RepID=A0A024TNX7_9STRA|nr:hypothetical protein H310_10884 [Aphanomyces invadans]ETV95840.1 hypothetical protein H310_10884 [Aphanomyces invadans]|eukprot:XP_008875591.1 hypothetical protein H310_10884 [Aphanomyces invadans]
MKILYVTDVEGNWEYFLRFVRTVATSPHSAGALSLVDGRLVLQPGYIFVFGGDVGDKGNGTLRLVHLLVDAKQRYPDRVVLIAGNRDVNKMRWTSEFTDAEMNLATMDPGIKDGPHWIPEASRKHLGIVPYLTQLLDAQAATTAPVTEVDLTSVNTPVNRIKWILACTMGSDGDFERRRSELAFLRGCAADESISDDDVLRSFRSSVDDGGIVRTYLKLCVLGIALGSTLIVHGGVFAAKDDGVRCCLGRVPPVDSHTSYAEWVAAIDASGPVIDATVDVGRWMDELNAWYRAQLHEWERFPTWNADHTFRGGENLQHYVNTGAAYSVIAGRHLEPSGMPKLMPQKLTDVLWAQGYRRMLVGHTPHGNTPTIVKHRVTRNHPPPGVFQVVMCDTSYSDTRAPDMRGRCTSIVVVDHPTASQDTAAWRRGDDDRAHLWIEGHLDLSQPPLVLDEVYGFCPEHDLFVGHVVAHTGEWVKAPLANDRYLVCAVTNAHTYTYAVKSTAELARFAAPTTGVQRLE